MVFFTCNHCGESVKKPSVEKHYNTKCRGNKKSVSCMDCLKDFDENYTAHTKCISELEKYSGKGFVARDNQNKGEKKQEGWVSTVRGVLDSDEYNLDTKTRSAFQTLQNYDNVPQKKAKFLNFVTNSVHIPRQTVENVWSILEKEQQKLKQARQLELKAAKQAKQSNDKNEESAKTIENGEPPKKKKKRKTVSENEVNDDKANEEKEKTPVENGISKNKHSNGGPYDDDDQVTKKHKVNDISEIDSNHFCWHDEFNSVLVNNVDGIAHEKMKKKILKKYKSKFNEELTEEQLQDFEKKFNKKLKKANFLKLEDNIVKAVKIDTEAEENIDVKAKKATQQILVENGNCIKKQKSGVTQDDEPKAKKQKKSCEISESEAYQFCWEDEFENILSKNAEGIDIEKMKKKILKKYKTKFNEELTERQIKGFEKKFSKKLKQNNFLKVEENIVKAVS